MRKFFLILSLITIFSCSAIAEPAFNIRGYDGIELPVGTLAEVINLRGFSSKDSDDTTKVSFMATNDTFMQETVIIPKGSRFFGFIEKMNEPVVGTNASMVIKITKMVLPDGFEIPMKGYIYTSNKNLIGGERTQPANYIKIPHYQKGLGAGTLKYVPGPSLKMGEHLTIAAGANLLIVFTSPAWITHTLTN